MSDRIYITIGVFRSHITIITSRYCGDIPVIASGSAAEQKSRGLRSIDIRVFSGFVIGGEPFRVRTRRRSFPRELPAEVRIPASRGATARGCRLRPSAPGFFHRETTLRHTEKVLLPAVFCYDTKTKRSRISLIYRIIRFMLRNLAQQKRPFIEGPLSGKRDYRNDRKRIEANKLIVCNICTFVPYSANGRFCGSEHRKAGVQLTNR